MTAGGEPGSVSGVRPFLGLAGLSLLAAACWPMQHQALPGWSIAALAAGTAIWAILALRSADPRDSVGPRSLEGARRLPPRRLALAGASVLAGAAWHFSAGGVFRTENVVPWLGACALWLFAWWRERAPTVPAPTPRARVSRTTLALLLAIFAAGAFLAFHRLAATPGNPTSDHAETLLDVQDLQRGDRPIFFPRNTGREPLKFYWIWFLTSVAGLPANYLTLKIATACLGLLAIPAVFLLARELGGDRLGLLAAALLAVSKWHVGMERVGLRFTYAVFPTAFVLWALCRYMARYDRRSALWAGLGIGVGLYGYIPFRIVPLLVPLALGLAMLDPRRTRRRGGILQDGLLIGATAAIVFVPLLRYMTERPDFFWERVATRAAELEQPVPASPPAVFADNVARMALAFHWEGTSTPVNAVYKDPFLDPMTGGLLLAGLLTAAVRAARGSRRWLLLLLCLFVLTLPSTLSLAFPEENPSINRAVAAIPAVLVLAALPLAFVLEGVAAGAGASAARGFRRAAVFGGVFVCLAVAAWQSAVRFFRDFDAQYPRVVPDSLSIARVVDEHIARGVPLYNVYLVSFPDWVDARNVAFEAGDGDWALSNAFDPNAAVPEILDRPLLFIFHPDDSRGDDLEARFRGERHRHPGRVPGREFDTYFVP